MTITLCMIVKNEEEVLARCLDSVKTCVDEIIVVDTGSTDATQKIASSYTDKIFSFDWINDFAAARNFSFEKATGDYIIWLDADDFVSEENQARLLALKKTLETERPDMVYCPYDVAFDGQGNAVSTYFRERLLRRESNFFWQGRVHECISPRGKIMYDDFRVFHLGSKKDRSDRNLDLYRKWTEEEPLGPRDKFYYGRELYYHRLYTEAIAVLEEMLAGDGWYVNKIEACKILSFCHAQRGNAEKALEALFQSFCYGEPRASVLCEIANLFKAQNRWAEAVFWYKGALLCRDHAAEGDFEEPNCRALTPLLELTYCCFQLGQNEKAVAYHQAAEGIAPNNPAVIYNRNYFKSSGLL